MPKKISDVRHKNKMFSSRSKTKLIAALGLILLLAACASAPDATAPEPTDTAAPLPSPTVVWFPPTATPTPIPLSTPTSTPDPKPGVGNLIFIDDFSTPLSWNTAVSDQATIDVSRNRLTIAVQPGMYALSLRQGISLINFYAEVTASLGLCKGADDYGILVRAIVSYYRFALSCDGNVRAERVSVGTRAPLQVAVRSGDAPLGSPGEVRIGIWVVGSEMRFFLNGRYQFTVTDANYRSGTIGLFARAAGHTPTTIIFSNLSVYSVDYTPAAKTPKP